MSVLDGCESKFKTLVPEDRKCPVCGRVLEVFTVKGRVVEDVTCECGHVIQAQELDSPVVEKKE